METIIAQNSHVVIFVLLRHLSLSDLSVVKAFIVFHVNNRLFAKRACDVIFAVSTKAVNVHAVATSHK